MFKIVEIGGKLVVLIEAQIPAAQWADFQKDITDDLLRALIEKGSE